MAVFLRGAEAETTETHGELGRSQRIVWQRCIRNAKEGGQASGDGFVVRTGIFGCLPRRQDPKQVIGAGRSTAEAARPSASRPRRGYAARGGPATHA